MRFWNSCIYSPKTHLWFSFNVCKHACKKTRWQCQCWGNNFNLVHSKVCIIKTMPFLHAKLHTTDDDIFVFYKNLLKLVHIFSIRLNMVVKFDFFFFCKEKLWIYILSIPSCYIIKGWRQPLWLKKWYANKLLVVSLGRTLTVQYFYSHLRMPVFVLTMQVFAKSVHPFHVKQYILWHISIYASEDFYTKKVYRRVHCILVVQASCKVELIWSDLKTDWEKTRFYCESCILYFTQMQ